MDINLNSQNPIGYKLPISYDDAFSSVKFKTGEIPYDVLVAKDIPKLYSNRYNFHHVLFIGDSFIAGDGLTTGQKTWAQSLIEIMKITNYDLFPYGGIGFTTPSAYSSNKKLDDTIRDITFNLVNNPNDITLIIVQAGLNDATTAYDVEYSNVNSFLTQCKTLFPNAYVLGLTSLNYGLMGLTVFQAINNAFLDNGFSNTTKC